MKLFKSRRNYLNPSEIGAVGGMIGEHDATSIHAIIRWSSDWQEWCVSTSYFPGYTYHTTDGADAEATARVMLLEAIHQRSCAHA